MYKNEKSEKLIEILKEIFQLDQSDLDFGIYRIMNLKSKEIESFLEKELLNSITKKFSKIKETRDYTIEQKEEFDKLNLDPQIQNMKNTDPETQIILAEGEKDDKYKKYLFLKDLIDGIEYDEIEINDVFSHLSTFFSRYYKDGDFVSLRRYKKDTY